MAQPPGRKPLPAEVKELTGNPGKRPIPQGVRAEAVSEDVEPPVTLSGLALAEWQRVAPQLARLGLLTNMDLTPLAAYCKAWGRYVEAENIVEAVGVLVPGYRGSMVKNPAAQVARDSLSDLMRICTEFGMTPSSRGRMSIPGEEAPEDPLGGILS